MNESLTMEYEAVESEFSWLDVDCHTLAEAMMLGLAPRLYGEPTNHSNAASTARLNKVFETL